MSDATGADATAGEAGAGGAEAGAEGADKTELGAADPFVVHRGLLFTVAYEMLGSAADAEDVLQESWLRWAAADRDGVRDSRAYLVRIVTRQALNLLRSTSRRREDYVGPWLPEPLLTSADVADDVVLAESVSVAMLTVLETLGPTERAVFVLREVFDVPFDEIADAVGKTAATVRQIAHRARDHVAARRPRISVDACEHERVVQRFIAVMNSGDVQGLMDVLAPDVVSVTDSGGLVRHAARRPLQGADRVVAFLQGSIAKLQAGFAVIPLRVNGTLAAGIQVGGELIAAVSFAVEDGRVIRVFSVANPSKLSSLRTEAPLVR